MGPTASVLDKEELKQTTAKPRLQRGRWFFLALVLLMFAIIAWVESPRFFLVGFYHPPDFKSEVIHVHVAVVASWMLVLLAQTVLGWFRNYRWHRALGTAGMVLAMLMLVMGILATADMLAREPEALHRSIVPFMQITMFAFFAGLAYWKRGDREAHKRLIMLAMVDPLFGVLVPVTHRVMGSAERVANLSWGFLILLALYDLRTRGRLHPVTVWGGALLVVVQEVRVPLGQTAAWTAVAEWMRSWGL